MYKQQRLFMSCGFLAREIASIPLRRALAKIKFMFMHKKYTKIESIECKINK
jgi:hypothetical protein